MTAFPALPAPFRRATPADAPDLARLIDLAGEGIPCWLWRQGAAPGQDPLDAGAARARREEGGFSYRNAVVAEAEGGIAGMLLAYRLPAAPDPRPALDDVAPVLRPLIRLEWEAPGSFYVNAIAVFPGHRGQGYGRRLLALADDLARDAGADRVSLQVFEGNAGAVRLYRRLGFVETASSEAVPHESHPHHGRLLLMERPLAAAR